MYFILFLSLSLYKYISIYVCMYACKYVCMYVFMYVCIYLSIYLSICIDIQIDRYTDIDTDAYVDLYRCLGFGDLAKHARLASGGQQSNVEARAEQQDNSLLKVVELRKTWSRFSVN